MKNNCELCGGKYDFRMVQIDKYLDVTGIAFSGSKKDKSIMIIVLDFVLSVEEN